MQVRPAVKTSALHQVPDGHLVIATIDEKLSFCLTTHLADGTQDQCLVILDQEGASPTINLIPKDSGDVIDLGPHWDIDLVPYLVAADFPAPNALRSGSLLVGNAGTLGISVRDQSSTIKFYWLDTKMVLPNKPSFRAVFTQWEIVTTDKTPRELLLVTAA